MNNLLKLKQESRKNVFDNLYTPKGVTKPLIEFLEENIFQDKESNKCEKIWECCDLEILSSLKILEKEVMKSLLQGLTKQVLLSTII